MQYKFTNPLKIMPPGQVSSYKMKVMLEKEMLTDSAVKVHVQTQVCLFPNRNYKLFLGTYMEQTGWLMLCHFPCINSKLE